MWEEMGGADMLMGDSHCLVLYKEIKWEDGRMCMKEYKYMFEANKVGR